MKKELLMKKTFLHLATTILLLTIIVIACKKEKNPEDSVTFIISEATNISESGATFDVSVRTNITLTNKGICYSSQNSTPTTEDFKISKGSGVSNYKVTLTDLTDNTGYFVRPYAIADGETYYGEVITFTTLQEKGVLINGIRWATRNVGKPEFFTAKPENAGMFYQWNSKVGWSSKDPLVNSIGGSIWDSIGYTGITIAWEKANDPCPTGWRIPTKAELQNLISTISSWEQLSGVSGRLFAIGEQSLFLPAVGGRDYSSELNLVGKFGNYWSSDVNDFGASAFTSTEVFSYLYTYNRANGFSVRCVAE